MQGKSSVSKTKGKGRRNKSHQPLTDREWLVLQLIAEGLSNQEIAERLTLSITTIKWYVKQIFNKLGVFRRTQAIHVARTRNLIIADETEPIPALSLPLAPTPLIGRDDEINSLQKILKVPTNRLVTILGPGGIGKTQLALEVARQVANQPHTQVCFVELEGIHSRSGIAPAIANAIGFQFSGSQEPELQLLTGLRDRRNLLLVLDNVEHLADMRVFISATLNSASGVKVLDTSRERLHLHAETVFSLAGLKYPSEIDEESKYPSIQLFVETTLRSDPSTQFSLKDMNAIRRICNLVEGSPLAIELAASWMGVLTPAQIADQITVDSDTLQTQYRDLPERHRSMRAVFEYSWQLLSQSERDVFGRLSVFRGGFDRDAAEQVASASLFMLSSFIDKSLLMRVGPDRFKLHELLRQFAAEKLQLSTGENTETLRRHCNYYADLMRDYESKFKSDFASYFNIVMSIQRDFDNILYGWNFALERSLLSELGGYIFSLSLFYFFRGLLTDGERHFARARELLETNGNSDRILQLVRAYTSHGWFLSDLMQYEQAQQVLTIGAELARSLDGSHSQDVGLVLCFSGWVYYLNDHLEEGLNNMQKALSLCQEADFQLGVWICLSQISEVEFSAGNYSSALNHQLQAISIAESSRNLVSLLTSLLSLGGIYSMLDNIPKACECFRQGLTINRNILAPFPFFMAMPGIALLCQRHGRTDVAVELLVHTLSHSQRGAAVDHKARNVLKYIRKSTLSLEMELMIEKVQRRDMPNLYLSPQFVITTELTDRFLNLLAEIEKN